MCQFSLTLLVSFDIYTGFLPSETALVDINPLSETSHTLLFSYAELRSLSAAGTIAFRCIESTDDARLSLCEKIRLPYDLLHVESDMNKMDFNSLLP